MPKQTIAGWESHWISINDKPGGRAWYYGVKKGNRVFPLTSYTMAYEVKQEVKGSSIVRWASMAGKWLPAG